MKILFMRNILVLNAIYAYALLLVTQPLIASADTLINGVHVSYKRDIQSAKLTQDYLIDSQDKCNRIFKTKLEIVGNLDDLPKATIDEFYSADGAYQSRVRHGFMNTSKKICVIEIKPFTIKKIFSLKERTVYKYSSDTDKWKKTTYPNMPIEHMAKVMSETQPIKGGDKSTGKDRIANLPCDIYTLLDAFTVCVWNSASSGAIKYPQFLNLSSKIQNKNGAVDTTIAEEVNLLSTINADDILPPLDALKAK